MKESIILGLVTDGSCYFDNISLFEIEEYAKNNEEVHEMLEKFCEGMPEDEKFNIMWKFDTAQGALEAITAEEYFKEGFKLGLKLAAQNFLE